MNHFFKIDNKIQAIIMLRCVVIVIQLMLILFVNIGLSYQLPWLPLLTVIAVEIVFTLGSYHYYRHYYLTASNASQQAVLIQISADILFLSLILYFSGGATNAFVSLLLIPIAIAAVTLTSWLLAIVALLAIASYSLLLWLLPMSVMHGNMQGHFIGMGINFLFSALVVAIVVGKMARNINQQALAIAAYRENLLKQEQVTALGVASAQITHQLATPIATVQLLADELNEDFPDNPVIDDMLGQLKRCSDSLADFRSMVFDIKEQAIKPIDCRALLAEIVDTVQVSHPEILLTTQQNFEPDSSIAQLVYADAALLPAIINLINNAIRASLANNSVKLHLTSQVLENQWQLIIRDFGQGFTVNELDKLGIQPVESEQGFGMAVFLSHASLERLGGKLTLTNHQEGGAMVTLGLPTDTATEVT